MTHAVDAAVRAEEFFRAGWLRFERDPRIAAWVEHALPAARRAVQDPANASWRRGDGTWFVGVDVLPNDSCGRLAGGPPLAGDAIDFVEAVLGGGALALHRAQVSVCHPGYPGHGAEESARAYRFRVERDAAHVDGLLPVGPQRRRFLRAPHAWVLGLPLTAVDRGAAPPVVWEGSHRVMRAMFERCLAEHAPETWDAVDLTEAYQQTRREVFARCPRIVIDARPGEAFLWHRHVLHGVAPWKEGAQAGADGRMIAYFRPRFGHARQWLEAP